MQNINIASTKQSIKLFDLIKEGNTTQILHHEINTFCESLLEKEDFREMEFENGIAQRWFEDEVILFPLESGNHVVYSRKNGISFSKDIAQEWEYYMENIDAIDAARYKEMDQEWAYYMEDIELMEVEKELAQEWVE